MMRGEFFNEREDKKKNLNGLEEGGDVHMPMVWGGDRDGGSHCQEKVEEKGQTEKNGLGGENTR